MTFVPQASPFEVITETFSATGLGTIEDVSLRPMRNYTMMAVGTGAAATAWAIKLEGSLDGTVFSEVMEHNTLIGDSENLFSGTTLFPALYLRLNCTQLTLGAATDVVITVLTQQ